MKYIRVTTMRTAQNNYRIVVFINGKMTEQHVATHGDVVNARNGLLDYLCNDPDVVECKANAIPFPFTYNKAGGYR